MILVYAAMLLAPYFTLIIGAIVFDTPFGVIITEYGKYWIFVSPIWATIIGVVAYFHGKTIEVVETAKFAVSTVQENKHHAVNFVNFLKKKVKRG